MATFQTSTDIANRGLQHLGVPRIAFLNPPDNSKQAVEASFIYDKLRRAELRRIVWTFATRRVMMRPVVPGSTQNFVPTAWAIGTTYVAGALVTDTNGLWWLSLQAANIGNTPTDGLFWQAWNGQQVAQSYSTTVTYLPGDLIYISSAAYLCTAVALNQAPANGAPYWLALAGTLSTILILSPAAYTPLGVSARTMFRLPYNYLRIAPQDPKVAGIPRQAVGAGMRYNDWELEGGYILSAAQTTPFVMRYVGDVTYVPSMEDMFCEGLGARMGRDLNEILTQSPDKQKICDAAYTMAINDARAINAIEFGSTEDPLIASDEGEQAQPQGGQGGG